MAEEVTVTVKWGKESYTVDIDPSQGVDQFRGQLFALTQVPPERQKIMGFKGGVLKDGANWTKAGLRPGMKIMMIGTAGELAKPPTAAELAAMEEKAEEVEGALEIPVGLANLGNTCYMNSTLQCLRKVPELKAALVANAESSGAANGADGHRQLAVAAGQLFRTMDAAKEPQGPFMFLSKMHGVYPQFAEKSPQGSLMQHDAEECWNAFLMSVALAVPATHDQREGAVSQSNSVVSELFQGVLESRLTCAETDAEPEVVIDEAFQKLTCNIDKQTAHMMSGVETALAGPLEKNSDVLGRSAQWSKISRIKQLPYYLTMQFVRFYWRQDVNKGAGDKAKICKPVTFPFVLDMYSLCTTELKKELDTYRDAQDKAEEGGVAPMDVDGEALVNRSGRYELCAVLSHKGRSADSGHYVSWIKYDPPADQPKARKDLWVCYDDDKPSYVTEEDVKKLSGQGGADWHIGYMFLYRTKNH